MYIEFGNFRIGRYTQDGTTGFSASIFIGVKKVGLAKREDGLKCIEDISVTLTSFGKDELKKVLKHKTKRNFNGEPTPWNSHLFAFSLIENHFIFEKIKKYLLQGKIVLKLENKDYFQVFNIPNNPQNLSMLKKTYDKIEILGQEFVDKYVSICKFGAVQTS